ncbi:hypothetical protein [Arthrobacter sp. ISL-72]|uniref:WD40/YVTN/BNR-like repeat-containing protein n=1 Tax=Arthrobacter sp. ISL-72 TaxID=2819114 RepID=UPI001BED25C4|nr:hypothetical protein [Arthrobacter sp. ISL-72]MBT2594680.1 hypothetical protein [Arthrobacter sp. ISL-72]
MTEIARVKNQLINRRSIFRMGSAAAVGSGAVLASAGEAQATSSLSALRKEPAQELSPASGEVIPPPVRVPVLTISDMWPSAHNDYSIAWAQGDIAYGVSRSGSTYKSIDGGKTWVFLGSNSIMPAQRGMWIRLASGTHITILNSLPLQIGRSTNDGANFSSVKTLEPNELSLTAQSWCQDEVTGYIYLGIYQITDSFKTINIYRSADDGATWTVWYAFPGIASNDPQKIRHIHGVQYDPFSRRVYFMVGDNEDAAGIYRVTADGSTVEKVVTKATAGHNARAIGLMCFPDYLVWASDSQPLGYLVRMPRSEIGKTNPQVERIYQLNSSGWGSICAAKDMSEWICFSSGESTPANPIDRNAHAYYVTNNGATIYELGAMSSQSASRTPVFHPVGQASLHDGQTLWMQTKDFFPEAFFRASISKSSAQIARPSPGPRVYAWESSSSGLVSIPTGSNTITPFMRARVPISARTLYVHDAEIRTVSGSGTAPRLQIIRTDNGSVLMETSGSIRVGAARREADEFVLQLPGLPSDVDLEFRIVGRDPATVFSVTARITFAFGY